MTKPLLSRRTILRGIGTMMALPVLDAMLPSSGILRAATVDAATGAVAAAPPVRLAFMFLPNGVNYPAWTPTGEGTAFELSKLLEPLAPVKSSINVLTGLTLNGARELGDGPGDHARSSAAFLTGAHPRKTKGKDIRLGVSIDQVAANRIGDQTRLPSLELGIERPRSSGDCDSGYSCAYTNISWRSESSPMPTETDPSLLFDRLFGSTAQRDIAAAAHTVTRRKSILDFVSEDARSLKAKLGAADLQKLDEFSTSIREIERRIENAKAADARALLEKPNMDRPAAIPANFEDHMHLVIDLLVLAYQMDITRVSSLLVGQDGSDRQFPELGIREGHHSLSHHGGNPKKVEAIQKIDMYHMSQLTYFVQKLASVREGDKTLLDNTALLCGGGISDGNRHNHEDLPIILAGGGGGKITTGRHIVYRKNTPLTNLYLSMLDMVNVKEDRFSDSTGRLTGLKA